MSKNILDKNLYIDRENLEKKLSTILGATKREIKIGDSTSINLYQIVFSLLKSNLYEKTLISDSFNFPSDNYILEGLSSNFNIKKPIIINYSQSISAEVNLIEKNPVHTLEKEIIYQIKPNRSQIEPKGAN